MSDRPCPPERRPSRSAIRRVVAGCLTAFGVSACAAEPDADADSTRADAPSVQLPGPTASSRLLAVQATDDAYVHLPDTLSAGRTHIVLDNRGKQRHELALARLRPGVSPSAAFTVARSGGDPTSVIDTTFGIVVAAAGATSTDTLDVLLEGGREYAIVCFLRDVPGQPEHAALGMFKSFVARH